MDMDAGSATNGTPTTHDAEARVIPARDDLTALLFDHMPEAWDEHDIGVLADAVLAVLADQPTVAAVREQIARDIEAEYDALAKDPEDSFWAGYRGATETAARIIRGGAA